MKPQRSFGRIIRARFWVCMERYSPSEQPALTPLLDNVKIHGTAKHRRSAFRWPLYCAERISQSSPSRHHLPLSTKALTDPSLVRQLPYIIQVVCRSAPHCQVDGLLSRACTPHMGEDGFKVSLCLSRDKIKRPHLEIVFFLILFSCQT